MVRWPEVHGKVNIELQTASSVIIHIPDHTYSGQVTGLVKALDKEMDRQEIQDKLGLAHRENFRANYLKPALNQGLIEMTIPDRPNSSLQKYRLTILGKQLKKKL